LTVARVRSCSSLTTEGELRQKKGEAIEDCLESFNGRRVAFKHYTDPHGVYQPNWVMWCGNPDHRRDCHRRRGATAAHEAKHGIIEPLAFLHVWSDICWPTRPTVRPHACETVDQGSVDRLVAERRVDLEEVARMAGR
jgi:hypothetical protein